MLDGGNGGVPLLNEGEEAVELGEGVERDVGGAAKDGGEVVLGVGGAVGVGG